MTVKLNDEKHKTATKGNSKGKAEWGERFEWIKARARPPARGAELLCVPTSACCSTKQCDLLSCLKS